MITITVSGPPKSKVTNAGGQEVIARHIASTLQELLGFRNVAYGETADEVNLQFTEADKQRYRLAALMKTDTQVQILVESWVQEE